MGKGEAGGGVDLWVRVHKAEAVCHCGITIIDRDSNGCKLD